MKIIVEAAMQLWEKGMFSLEDDLADYMPAFREMTVKTDSGIEKAKNPIKIHHLFEMTAGLNYNLQTPALQTYYDACDRLTPQQRLMYTYSTPSIGYGLGMRAPRQDPNYTEFGWGGAAGAFASVDPVNNVTIFYAQHVIAAPNRPLRQWLYDTVQGDLLGQTVQVPIHQADETPTLTY